MRTFTFASGTVQRRGTPVVTPEQWWRVLVPLRRVRTSAPSWMLKCSNRSVKTSSFRACNNSMLCVVLFQKRLVKNKHFIDFDNGEERRVRSRKDSYELDLASGLHRPKLSKAELWEASKDERKLLTIRIHTPSCGCGRMEAMLSHRKTCCGRQPGSASDGW